MTLKKVAKGDPLAIPADAYNAFVDAARDHQARRLGQTAGGSAGVRDGGTVLVRNDSGAPRDRFDVLGIAGPVFDPTDEDQADQFAGQVVLAGVLVSSYLHEGQFAVLQEPVADGALGRAVVCGLTIGRLFVDEGAENTRWATPAWGKPYLRASSTGTADVLWKEPGESEDEEDLKWAVLRLGSPAHEIETEAVYSGTVTGRWKRYGEPWTGTGFIEFVTAVPTGESGPVLYLQCTRGAADAKIGFKDIQVGDVVGYAKFEDRWAGVPGSDGKSYDGVVLVHAGTVGARLSGAAVEADVLAGPGITVEDEEEGAKISADLAAEKPGLEFDAPGDDGALRVLPDPDRGIQVEAAGVGIALAAEKPGLHFLDGGLAVLPDGAGGIVVTAAGVGILLAPVDATHGGLLVDGAGLTVFAGDGLAISTAVREKGSLYVNISDGLRYAVEADDAIAVALTPEGVGGGAGLEFEAEGRTLQVKDGVGLTRDGNVLKVLIEEDGSEGLRFEPPGGKELQHAPPGAKERRIDLGASGWIDVDKFGHVIDGDGYE